MNAKTPRELVKRLTQNPSVLGLVRYGSRGVDDVSEGGDFDLFVFADGLSDDAESLHFYVDYVPVDLNLRRLADLQQDEPRTPFDRVLLEGEILFDRTGALKDAIASAATRWAGPCALTEHDIAMNRFCQQHVLDKVRGRLHEDPLYCEFLLGANIHWLVAAYFRVRLIPFPGEKRALRHLATAEPNLHQAIKRFYASQSLPEKLAITEQMTGLVLVPIGGPWRRDEVLAFGYSEEAIGLQDKGRQVLTLLLRPPPLVTFRLRRPSLLKS